MFFLKSINMIKYISTLSNTNPSLRFWNNPHLVVKFHYFNVWPDSVCRSLIEDFYIDVPRFR